ncbi:hypothetical protein E0E54_02770 [Azotobacter chroococcum]|uniref:hypothetical protein n=1 Tax=Azotobacter chroococcum TaxID=353 RepID=UPI00103D5D06|nr:hypothetical protein [Azotobacter chroococcum]TBW39368.1 hypothetical protein E0E54_02770 [Azotobacter chroococcum]
MPIEEKFSQKIANCCPSLVLFFIGMAVLFVRNPDPVLNPVVYAEDGMWAGLGLSNGWHYALIHAREDYFVFLNILLLFIATKLSVWGAGNPVALLPESIALVSFGFFSAVATAAFLITKGVMPILFRGWLYLLLLLLPLGMSQNEIVGRILQVGFYIPLISVMLLFWRDQAATYLRIMIDAVLFLCAATNPVIFAIVFLYLVWDFFKDRDLEIFRKKNLTIIISFLVLLVFLLPRMGGRGGVPGEFLTGSFIEVFIGRAILYPLVFPWYEALSDRIVIVALGGWLIFVWLSFVLARNQAAKRIMVFLIVTLVVYDVATIAMRPGLTEFFSNYQGTYLDRYFMGVNVLVVFLTMVSLSQLFISGNFVARILGGLGLLAVVWIYGWHLSYLLETNGSRLAIKDQFDFRDQLCLSKDSMDKSHALVQIYPNVLGWQMKLPVEVLDRSHCEQFMLEEAPFVAGVTYQMRPSPQLGLGSPIKIFMSDHRHNERVAIQRLGVMFGVYGRKNQGDAELRLRREDGSTFVQRFSLLDLIDNKYRYFDIDPERYVSAEIVSVTGGGVSTWESYDERGDNIKTCTVYEYSDGKRRFTSGCPLF